MDDAVREYVEAIDPEHRGLFDRVQSVLVGAFPEAEVVISYQMPTYVVGERRLHVGVWKHGVSIYGIHPGADAGFCDRHPELQSGRGTTRISQAAAATITDDELSDLFRAALAG